MGLDVRFIIGTALCIDKRNSLSVLPLSPELSLTGGG